MSRFNIIVLFAAAGVLALAGCSKEPEAADGGNITIEASVGAMTKVSYDGDKTGFTDGDQIAVFGWTGSADAVPATRVVDGVVNTLGTDGKWTPESPMLWKPGLVEHYFLGVYPVHAITDYTADDYTLDPANYAASDLLIATNLGGVTASQGAVELVFDHLMARLDVNLKFRSEFDTTPTVTSVTALARSAATVNYLTKAVTATGDAAAVNIPAAASVPTGYDLSFSGLQVPQEGVRKITVTIGGKEYVYESATDIPLTTGKYTTLGLLVGKDKIELGSLTVNAWTAEALPAGDAFEEEVDPYNGHAFVVMGNGHKWATCNVGATNPEDSGYYFAWGETAPKDYYDWNTYTKQGDELEAEDDAAHAYWGGKWRTPTFAEWEWLADNCTWTWTDDFNGTGVKGMIVTSKIAGYETNCIFLPAAGAKFSTQGLEYFGTNGMYRSTTLGDYDSTAAFNLIFYSSGRVDLEFEPRCFGMSIRPVV